MAMCCKSNITFFDFCCFSCEAMSQLQTVLNYHIFSIYQWIGWSLICLNTGSTLQSQQLDSIISQQNRTLRIMPGKDDITHKPINATLELTLWVWTPVTELTLLWASHTWRNYRNGDGWWWQWWWWRWWHQLINSWASVSTRSWQWNQLGRVRINSQRWHWRQLTTIYITLCCCHTWSWLDHLLCHCPCINLYSTSTVSFSSVWVALVSIQQMTKTLFYNNFARSIRKNRILKHVNITSLKQVRY